MSANNQSDDVIGMVVRPAGVPARRPLHFIWIVDCSGSMAVDGRIQELNFSVREALPEMQRLAAQNPAASVLVRVARFADGAGWQVPEPTPVEEFRWLDLTARGVTDMGAGLQLVAEGLRAEEMPARGLPPVLVLVSDGRPTDDVRAGLEAIVAEPWGAAAVRIAVAIGDDADLDVLQQFVGRGGTAPLRAHSPESLVSQIRWVSTTALKHVSAPSLDAPGDARQAALPVPSLAPRDGSPAEDVW